MRSSVSSEKSDNRQANVSSWVLIEKKCYSWLACVHTVLYELLPISTAIGILFLALLDHFCLDYLGETLTNLSLLDR